MMQNVRILLLFCFSLFWVAPKAQNSMTEPTSAAAGNAIVVSTGNDIVVNSEEEPSAEKVISFARTLKGIPYKYGCSDPAKGFDCSGFVMYVFNHFEIQVPRSSSGFTNFGKEIDIQHSVPGDIILFTGTNSKVRKIGHVGIVTQTNNEGITFIHASSGKVPAVVETIMNPHYKERFMKVIRVLPKS